jgi:hypothetical protein
MRAACSHIARDQGGATTVEFTIVMVLFFLLTFGITEFGYMLYQWNSAAKAAQVGARLAAVSDSVWGGLASLTSGGTPGGPWTTNYSVTCQGSNVSGSSGNCTGTSSGNYSAAALQRIIFGRGQTTCGTIGTDGDAGMCDIFDRITPQNVQINYKNTGLGFAGRPGGPVPTITLTLTGLTYQFIAVGDLMGFGTVTMPDFKITMTGEDLSAAAVP